MIPDARVNSDFGKRGRMNGKGRILARWIDDYQRYKLKAFTEQLLRVLNTMLGVFAFWNVVRNPMSAYPEMPGWLVGVTGVVAGMAGVIVGIAVLLRLPRSVQRALFPLTLCCFVLSSERDTVLRLVFTLLIAGITVTLPPFIVAVAKRINRR